MLLFLGNTFCFLKNQFGPRDYLTTEIATLQSCKFLKMFLADGNYFARIIFVEPLLYLIDGDPLYFLGSFCFACCSESAKGEENA